MGTEPTNLLKEPKEPTEVGLIVMLAHTGASPFVYFQF